MMKRLVPSTTMKQLLVSAMVCGLVLLGSHTASAEGDVDGGGYTTVSHDSCQTRHPNTSYRRGYRDGCQRGYRDGKRDCSYFNGADGRSRGRFNQDAYDQGFANGYRTGHEAGCRDQAWGRRPDPSYSQGYRNGYRDGFDDGDRDCNYHRSDGRSRDRINQGAYDTGYGDGYDAGHEAACRY